MRLSLCLWALPGPEENQLTAARSLAFDYIDIQPAMLRKEAMQHRADALKLAPACVGVSFGLPAHAAADSEDEHARTTAQRFLQEALTHTARLGAATAYTVPGIDSSTDALRRYAHTVDHLAGWAAERGISLCIEHFPGRSLPTVAATLDFIESIGNPNLKLLLDLGHCQIADEDPERAIEEAGDRLGYVHLDDNDGIHDLHWALLDGVMSRETLATTFKALERSGYDGVVSLELSPQLPHPREALANSRRVLLEVAGAYFESASH